MFRLFDIDLKKLLLIVFVLALPLLSINLQKAPDEAPWYAEPFAIVAGGLQSAFTGLSTGVRGTTAQYLDLIKVKELNRNLVRENAEMKAKLQEFSDLQSENLRMKKLLNFQQRSQARMMSAQVVAQDLFSEHSTVRINRGTADGVKRGMAVITPEGVVGYVFDSEKHTSRVLVLTDRYSVIDGMVARSRARGVIEGQTSDRCRMKYLTRTDDVVQGDLVVATGLDNVFPKGFPIGTIVNVEAKKYGVTQKVEVQPIVDPSRVDEVFVLFQVTGTVLAESHQAYLDEKNEAPKVTN